MVKGRFDPPVTRSWNDGYLRIGAVHCVVFVRRQSPSGHRRKHARVVSLAKLAQTQAATGGDPQYAISSFG